MELHERIYQLRKEKNMTQQDLADQLGVSRQAVSRWEMGTAKPELDSLTAMSRIFGITVDELLTGEQAVMEETPVVRDKPEIKHSNRIWWILWVAAFAVSLAVAAIMMAVEHRSNPYSFVAISPLTLIAQVINMALTLGIVVFILRWLCRRRK